MNLRRLLPATLLLLAAGCASIAPQPARFKILQLNDVYKIEGLEAGQTGGLARVRALRQHLASDGTPVLVLHAGDALYPSVMSKYLEARPMVDVLNLLDGDPNARDPHLVITFGNHEFDKSDASVLLARLGESSFQWLATNSYYCAPECNQRFPGVHETMVVDAGGTRIGLLGLMYPMSKSYVKTTDVIAAARGAVDSLRGRGARVIVAITHQDMPDDVKLVQAVPGIDLVIGGHDHLYMQQQVGRTWIGKADADAKSVIVYDVTVPANGAIRTTPVRIALDATQPRDAQIDARVQRWMDELSKKLGGNDTLGTTRNLLEGVEPAVRGRETALGNLLADVARETLGTDVGVVNGGGIRINDNIPPGPITKYDMEGVFYYSNALVSFQVTGQQLLDMLRNSVSRVDAGDGRFLQVSGLAFTYSGTSVEAANVRVGGRPLDLNGRYTVATVDYLYEHGTEDGYELFSDANRPPLLKNGGDFRTAVEAYIRRNGTVEQDIEGRIRRN